MDPRQRMALEVAYELFESAGMPYEKVKGSQTAVYVGAGLSDYEASIQRDPEYAPKYALTGVSHEILANRISHYFDMHGPSMTVETACSSSLVAIHLACQSVRNGEADMAVAGGVNLILNPEMTIQLSNLGFLSPFGHCRSFDNDGDGYGRGEGCGLILIKRLADAQRDGDPIRAVIRGSGINSDGWTQGITLPSVDAQAALIRDVYRNFGLDMESTQFVECHGTGTKAGDPVEVRAIHETLGSKASPSRKLIVGSVKPNIGHLEAGAAVAGVIKGILAMENGMIPPQVYLNKLNEGIPFDDWNIHVPQKLTPWPVTEVKRMSVSSFAMGGTNAHVILEGVDKRKGHPLLTNGTTATASMFSTKELVLDKKRLFAFSAADQAGLERVAQTLADHLDSLGPTSSDPAYIANLAYTLGEGRSKLSWKTTCFAENGFELREKLEGLKGANAVRSSGEPRIGFVFTGQGAQWAGMGAELLERKVFGESFRKSAEYLKECGCEWDAIEELTRPASKSNISNPLVSQPMCNILQVALVDELRAWGVSPSKVVGHSSGEVAAAYAIGALSHKDAVTAAYFRGVASALIKTKASHLNGGMMAVGLGRKEAEKWISKVDAGQIVVACVNSPESVTISGDIAGIDQLLPMLEEDKIFARKLKVEVAYHSHHMREVMSDLLASISHIEGQSPSKQNAKMISSVTGGEVNPEDLGGLYWVKNLISPVLFADALLELVTPVDPLANSVSDNTVDMLIEIGPHSALGGPVQQILNAGGIKNVAYGSVLKRGKNGIETAFDLAADLFCKGAPLAFQGVNEDVDCKKLTDLPPYPWNHTKTFHAESRIDIAAHMRKVPRKSLIGAPLPAMDENERVWRGFLSLEEEPWIREHKVLSMILFPGAGMVSMILEAASQMADPGKVVHSYKLRDVAFFSAMPMSEDTPTETVVHVRPHIVSTAASNPHTWWEWTISSCTGRDQALRDNARGLMTIEYVTESEQMRLEQTHIRDAKIAEYKQVLESCPDTFGKEKFYETTTNVSWFYGPLFQTLDNMHPGKERCTYDVFLQDCGPTYSEKLVERPFLIHPAMLDAVFQSFVGGTYTEDKQLNIHKATVPTAVGEFEISARFPGDVGTCLKAYCTTKRHSFRDTAADVYWLDENLSELYLQVRDYRSTELSSSSDEVAEVGKKTETSDLCTAIDWNYTMDLITPEELKKVTEVGEDAPATEATSQIARMFLHVNPDASVIELLPQAAVGKGAMASVADAATLAGQIRYAVATTQGEALTDVFYLGDIDTPAPSDVASADLIVVSPACEGLAGFGQYLNKVLSLAKPTASILCTASPEVSGPILSEKNYTSTMGAGLFSHPTETKVNKSESKPEVVIIESPTAGDAAKSFAGKLSEVLGSLEYGVETVTWDSSSIVATTEGKAAIALLELEKAILDEISEPDFFALRDVLLKAERTLWLTHGDEPDFNMVDGLARVVRGEIVGTRFDVLHLSAATGLETGAALTGRVLNANSKDNEFREKNGALMVSRISKDRKENADVNHHLKDWTGVMPLKEHDGPLRLTVGQPGILDTLQFIPDDRWVGKPLGPREVEIEVKASGVNFRDVMSSMGILNDSWIGLEASGIVTAVGSEVTRVQVGDRVAGCGTGAHTTNLRTSEVACAKIPDSMSFEEAAAMSVVHTTAYHALVNLAKLRKGQSVLIHAAAGGVGQAACQLANYLGITIYATVGSPEKRNLLIEKYNVNPDHIFNSRDASFVHGVKRMTNGKGVNCIINSLSGELLRQSWYCLATFGTFVEIGLRDITGNTRLDMKPFMQNTTFTFFNLLLVMEHLPDEMAEIVTNVYDLVHKGVLYAPTVLTTYPLGAMEDAFRLMQSGRHLGKLVLTMGAEPQAPVLHKASNSLKLDPNATYLLVGGLGGLGRSLAGMFIDSGARNIAFVSRSGDSGAEAKKTMEALASRPGVNVKAYKADMADLASFEAAMAQCNSELPPVKGVVQMAMVLRDALFEKMTHQEWVTSIRPKVHGTRNLHKFFDESRPLDFMMFFSSCAGVFGNSGQANYAAGNTYQDELAYHRRSKGLAGVSVDLGIMRDVGVVAETGAKGFLAVWEEAIGIRENVFHAMMRSIINGQTDPKTRDTFPAQVSTGLATADVMTEFGLPRPEYFDDPRMARLAIATVAAGGAGAAKGGAATIESRLMDAAGLEEATEIITEALVQKTADILQMPASEVDPNRPMYVYGVDSLVAMEVRNWISREMKANMALPEILAAMPMEKFAGKIAERSKLVVVKAE